MISTILTEKRWVIPAITGVVSFAGGVGVGYLLTKKLSDDFTEEIVVEESQLKLFGDYLEPIDANVYETKEWNIDTHNDEHYREPLRVKYLEDEEVSTETIEVVAEEENLVNVFTNDEDEWDYGKELPYRTPNAPYIIHYDEFSANETECRQETLTYYAGDDIVADQTDQPIYNYKFLMGELRFGYGSNDPNVVYIRNPGINMEWEVLLHTSSFSEEVLGLEIEEQYEAEDLKHSHDRKFRPE